MVSIDYILKRHNTFIKNYNSLKVFQDKLQFEEYSYAELKRLKDELENRNDSSDLIVNLKVNVDLWLEIKKGAIHYPMINNYDYLSTKEKKELDEYLFNHTKGILDSNILENKDVYKDLAKDKIITLYSNNCKCPVCSTELIVREFKKKCPLCGFEYDNSTLEAKPKFVLNRK